MDSKFIEKTGLTVVFILIVIIAYSFSLDIGSVITNFIGFDEMTIFKFIVTVSYSSIVVFCSTLFLDFLFQQIPFLSEEFFIKIFYFLHIIFFYVSGLLATLVSTKPILINLGYITSFYSNETIQVFIIVFFIILSNYYIYDVIILQNKLKLIKQEGVISKIFLLQVILFFINLSWILRVLVIGIYDSINIIVGFILVAISIIKKIFFNNSEIYLQ